MSSFISDDNHRTDCEGTKTNEKRPCQLHLLGVLEQVDAGQVPGQVNAESEEGDALGHLPKKRRRVVGQRGLK